MGDSNLLPEYHMSYLLNPNSMKHSQGRSDFHSIDNDIKKHSESSLVERQPRIWDLYREFTRFESSVNSKKRIRNFQWRLEHGTALFEWHQKKNSVPLTSGSDFKSEPQRDNIAGPFTISDHQFNPFKREQEVYGTLNSELPLGPHISCHVDPPADHSYYQNNQESTFLPQEVTDDMKRTNNVDHTAQNNQPMFDTLDNFDIDNSFHLDNIPLAFNGLDEPLLNTQGEMLSNEFHHLAPSPSHTGSQPNVDFEPLQMYNFFDGMDFEVTNSDLLFLDQNEFSYFDNVNRQQKLSTAISKRIWKRKHSQKIKHIISGFPNTTDIQMNPQKTSVPEIGFSETSETSRVQNYSTPRIGTDLHMFRVTDTQPGQNFLTSCSSSSSSANRQSEAPQFFRVPLKRVAKPKLVSKTSSFSIPNTNNEQNQRSTKGPTSDVTDSSETSTVPHGLLQATKKNKMQEDIQCRNCKTRTTPLWRRDDDQKLLCNACGLFAKLHGTDRPLKFKTDVIKRRNRQLEDFPYSGSRRRNKNKIDRVISGRALPMAPSPRISEPVRSHDNNL